MIERAPANQYAADDEKRTMDGFDAFIAYLQTPERLEPREGALYDPAMPPQVLLRFNPSACDAINDAPIA